MMRVFSFPFLLAVLFIASCADSTPSKQPESVTTPPNEPKMVGADRDEHGCIGSAGYKWSVLKGECIRVFEKGIKLAPKAPHLDTTTVTYIVLKSDTDDAQVEVFMPSKGAGVLLDRVAKEVIRTWKGHDLTLKQWKGMYSLIDAQDQILYEGPSSR